MRPGLWTRAIALFGLAWVTGATFLDWTETQPSPAGFPRRIYTYQPGPLPAVDLWHAAPMVAVGLIALALLGALASLAPSEIIVLAFAASTIALVITVIEWLHFPTPGIGEPLAIIGTLELLAASTLTLLTQKRRAP